MHQDIEHTMVASDDEESAECILLPEVQQAHGSCPLLGTDILVFVPSSNIELYDIGVHGLGNDRAGRDGPVRPVRVLVLLVALEQDAGISGINFYYVQIVYIVYKDR